MAAKYPKLKLKYDQYKNHDTDEEFTPEEVKILKSYRLKRYELEEQLEERHGQDRKQQREFDDQDDEINQFQQTESDNKLTLVKSREGKSPFTQQDATAIVNSLLPSMKSSLTAQKLLPTTLNFTFNTAVTASSTNPKVAALLRRDFQMPLELAFKHHLITNKKYLSAPVTLSISA